MKFQDNLQTYIVVVFSHKCSYGNV